MSAADQKVILRTTGVSKSFGKFLALNSVTAEFERGAQAGRATTNLLLEFGVLGLLVPGLASAVWLVRRSRPA
jgi:hypothetical protein